MSIQSRLAAAALAAGVLGVSGMASAQEGPQWGQGWLSPSVNYMIFGEDRDIDDSVVGSFSGGYRFSQMWGIEATYSGAFSDPDVDSGVGSVDYTHYRGDVMLFPFEYEGFDPYFSVGGGVNDFNYDDPAGDDVDETAISAGVGVFGGITDRIAFRADARGIYGTDAEEVDVALSVGLAALIGESRKKCRDADADGVCDNVDKCPGTPPGSTVDANGCVPPPAKCVDADQDGVCDNVDKCLGSTPGAKVDASGCEPVEVTTFELKVNFAFDSDKITSQYIGGLDEAVAFLKAHPNAELNVNGHTDSVGTDAYNNDLSERRAYAVRDYIIDNAGVPAGDVEARGFGESQPVASNETDAGRAENRRVEAVLKARD